MDNTAYNAVKSILADIDAALARIDADSKTKSRFNRGLQKSIWNSINNAVNAAFVAGATNRKANDCNTTKN